MTDWEAVAEDLKTAGDGLRAGKTGSSLDTDRIRDGIDAVADELAARPNMGAQQARISDIKKKVDAGEIWPGGLLDASAMASAIDLDDAIPPPAFATVPPRRRL